MEVLDVEELSVTYENVLILENISWKVSPGEFWGLIGPNGAGKTTLIKALLGLVRPLKGSIRLFGQPISTFKDWSKIGYVPQKATAFDQNFPISVEEVVLQGRVPKVGILRRFTEEDLEIVNESLKTVGMAGLRRTRVGKLSTGQQQRVFIARALASQPSLLILDEPATGVDAQSEKSFYDLLVSLNKGGLTIIMISHDIGAVSAYADHVACVNRRIFLHGTSKELLRMEQLAKVYGNQTLILHEEHGH